MDSTATEVSAFRLRVRTSPVPKGDFITGADLVIRDAENGAQVLNVDAIHIRIGKDSVPVAYVTVADFFGGEREIQFEVRDISFEAVAREATETKEYAAGNIDLLLAN